MRHLASSLKDDSVVDAQAGRKNVSAENRGPMNFDPVPCLDASIDFTADNDDARFDLSRNPGAFSDNQCIRRIDLAAKDAANADGSLKAELPFELASSLNHPGDR